MKKQENVVAKIVAEAIIRKKLANAGVSIKKKKSGGLK